MATLSVNCWRATSPHNAPFVCLGRSGQTGGNGMITFPLMPRMLRSGRLTVVTLRGRESAGSSAHPLARARAD